MPGIREPQGLGKQSRGGGASKTVSSEPSFKHRSIPANGTALEVADLHSHPAGWSESHLTGGNPLQ